MIQKNNLNESQLKNNILLEKKSEKEKLLKGIKQNID